MTTYQLVRARGARSPRPTDPRPTDPRAAGLAAASALAGAPLETLVVEAAPRLGGRAHTVIHEGLVLDLGCGWLHSADRNPFTRIARDLGFGIDRTYLQELAEGTGGEFYDVEDEANLTSTFDSIYETINAGLPAADVSSAAPTTIAPVSEEVGQTLVESTRTQPELNPIAPLSNEMQTALDNSAGNDNMQSAGDVSTLPSLGNQDPDAFNGEPGDTDDTDITTDFTPDTNPTSLEPQADPGGDGNGLRRSHAVPEQLRASDVL